MAQELVLISRAKYERLVAEDEKSKTVISEKDDNAEETELDVLSMLRSMLSEKLFLEAKAVYDRLLTSDPAVITWDRRGTVSVHDVELPGTSIVEFLSEYVNPSKGTPAKLYPIFRKAIEDILPNSPGPEATSAPKKPTVRRSLQQVVRSRKAVSKWSKFRV